MEKYLFSDGTGGVREVQSAEELKTLVQSTNDPSKIRIWVFNTSQWISYSDFSKGVYPDNRSINFSIPPVAATIAAEQSNGHAKPLAEKTNKKWLKKFLFFIAATGAIFLVYNFTKIKWERAGTIDLVADRPANSPKLDVDSLIQLIEGIRGQPLDRFTRTNFRTRNTWPDKISLKLTADLFTNKATNKYSNIELSIDNSTGYNLDNAVVQLNTWKKKEPDGYRLNNSDTFRIANIGYVMPVKRKIDDSYRGDSISVSFFSIRSKDFNFCYSLEKQSNSGNTSDRWFCKE